MKINTTSNMFISFKPPFHSGTKLLSPFTKSINSNPKISLPHLHIFNGKLCNSVVGAASPPPPEPFISRFSPNEPRKGSEVLVEALERHSVTNVFAYPGDATFEIHQSLSHSTTIHTILPRHEQGGVFAAEGYARASGHPGVCIATWGPGATNIVTGLVDALLNSVPIIAIIGTDAYRETSVIEVTRSITKHNYFVSKVEDIPRIIREAFYLAGTGRPGPVLINIPKDI